MKLKDFIEKFVAHNTVVRLWHEKGHTYQMIHDGEKEVSMEWEVIGGKSFLSKYLESKVVCVTDIVCNKYPEAVNIVIE